MSLEEPQIAGIVVADATRPGHPMTYVSPGFEALTGYRSDEVLGRSCSLLQGPDTDPRAVEELRRAIAEEREAYVTLRNYRRDGTAFWNEVAIAAERDDSGRVVRYLGVQKDVTARMDAERRVLELAYQDSLTGLANRATLQEELATAIARATIHDEQLALLFIDLDDFKHVNDSHGHAMGDELLRAAAERLRSVLRPQDVLARQGGDEFLLLVTGCDDAEAIAPELAERVLSALQAPFDSVAPGLRVRASIGVSVYPRDAQSAQELLGHADAAMYAAKDGGKNRVHVSGTESATAPHSRIGPDATSVPVRPAPADEQELTRILREQDITSVYQAIIDLTDERVVGYEALARGPQGSVLQYPDRLFAAAAATDQTAQLDWLCRIAAVRGARRAGLGRQLSLFVNCEPSAVDSPCPAQFAEEWRRAQRELDLVLEITERAVTSRPAELARMIERHRAAGSGIALDDVGADVRSLAVLPLLQPDLIKLDLGLVQNRPSLEQAAIVSAVSAQCERTGAVTVAEGIETDEHLAVARALGASLGQGYRWGRPGPLRPVRGTRWRRPVVGHTSAVAATPFDALAGSRDIRHASKRLLLPISHHLENRALWVGEGAVILSTFQYVHHFTARTRARYARLAHGASLVAAFASGIDETPVPGVRGAAILPGDRLEGEWSVVVLGPHFAGALLARDLGRVGVPDPERMFEYATTYDRGLVVEAARALLARISPVGAEAAEERAVVAA